MNNRKELNHLENKVKKADSVEHEILEGLGEFTEALEKGEVTKRLTCRQIKLNLIPKEYRPKLVKKTRKVLRVSQPLFALFLGVSVKSVRAWEQGVNPVPKMACRFMDEIRRHPRFWIDRLREATVTRSGCEDL